MKNLGDNILAVLAFFWICLMVIHSKILNLKNKVGEEKIIFAFLPKITNDGKIYWFTFLKRKVIINHDFISFAHYNYWKE